MDTNREDRHRQPAGTAVTGPLAPYADGWRQELARRGFAPHSITAHAQLIAHLSGWMVATGQGTAALIDEAVVQDYLRARREAGYRNRTTGRAVAPFVEYLRGLHAVPEPVSPVPAEPVVVLLEEFGTFLVNERGLATVSVRHYQRCARLFLDELGSAPLDAALEDLSAGTVTTRSW